MDKPFLIGELLGKDLLICSLCSEYYKDPRILPCEDTFCRKCLQKLFDEKQAKTSTKITTMPCPKCRASTIVPPIGISGFPLDMNIRKKKEEFMNKLMDNVGSSQDKKGGTDSSKTSSLPRVARQLLEERQREQQDNRPSYMKSTPPTSPEDYLKSRPAFSPAAPFSPGSARRNKVVDGLIRGRRERSPHVSTMTAPSATPLFTPMDPYVDEDTHANRPFSGSRPSRLASPRVRLHSGARHKSDPGLANMFKSPTSPSDGFLSPDTSTSSGRSTPSPLSPETNNNIPGSYKVTDSFDIPKNYPASDRPSRTRRNVHFQDVNSDVSKSQKETDECGVKDEHSVWSDARTNTNAGAHEQRDSRNDSVSHSQSASVTANDESGRGRLAGQKETSRTSNIKPGGSPVKVPLSPPSSSPVNLTNQKSTSSAKSAEQRSASSSLTGSQSKQQAKNLPSSLGGESKKKAPSLKGSDMSGSPRSTNGSTTVKGSDMSGSPRSTNGSTTVKSSGSSPQGEEAKVETVEFSDKVCTSPGKVRRRPNIPTSLTDKSLSPDGRTPYVSPTRGVKSTATKAKTGKTPQINTNSLPQNHPPNVFTFDGASKCDKTKDISNKGKHSGEEKKGPELTGNTSSRSSVKNAKNISATTTKENIRTSIHNRKMTNTTKNDVTPEHIIQDKVASKAKVQEMGRTKDNDTGHVKVHGTAHTRDKDMGHVKVQGTACSNDKDMGHVKVQGTARTKDKDMGHVARHTKDKDINVVKVQEAEHTKSVHGVRLTSNLDSSTNIANKKYPTSVIDMPSKPRTLDHKGASSDVLETGKVDTPDVVLCKDEEIKVTGTTPLSGSKSSVKSHGDTGGTRQTHSQRGTDRTPAHNGYKVSPDHPPSATRQHVPDRPGISKPSTRDADLINRPRNKTVDNTPSPDTGRRRADEDTISTQCQGHQSNVSIDNKSKVCNEDREITESDSGNIKPGGPVSCDTSHTLFTQEEVTILAEVVTQQQRVISDSQHKSSVPKNSTGTPVISGPTGDRVPGKKHQESINSIDPLTQKIYTVKVEKAKSDSSVEIPSSNVENNRSVNSKSRAIPVFCDDSANKVLHNNLITKPTTESVESDGLTANNSTCETHEDINVNKERINSYQDITGEIKSEIKSEAHSPHFNTSDIHSTEQSEGISVFDNTTPSSPRPGEDVINEDVSNEETIADDDAHDSPWKTIYQDIYDDITREVSEERDHCKNRENKGRRRIVPPSFSLDISVHDESLDTTDDADRSSLKDDSTQTPGGRISSEERHIGGATNLEDSAVEEMPEEEDMTPEHPIYSTSECWSLEKRDYEMPTSMVVLTSGTSVVSEFNSGHLQYFDDTGTFMHSVSGVKPFCITIDKQDRVIVADRKNKTIRGFDEWGVDSIQWEDDRFKWISGIGCLNNGNLVIYDRDNYKVGIYTTGGVKVYEFGSYGERDTQLCMADFLTVDSKDRILLCDSGNHCIKMFDVNGRFLHKFGSRGHMNGQMEWPKGICCDDRDNIIVADNRNRRVSLYSPDGEFIQHLVKDFPNPYAVCRNATNNKLGVTHYSLSGLSQLGMYSMSDYVMEDVTDGQSKTDDQGVTDGADTAACSSPGVLASAAGDPEES